MDELERKFRHQLRHQELDEIDDTWLELVDSGATLEHLLELAQLVAKHGSRPRAAVLLSVLGQSRAEQGRSDEQLLVQRRQAELSPDDQNLAREIAAAMRRVHAAVPELEELLRKSGLGYGQSLKESLPRLDLYIAFVPGRRVFEPERGPGRVKKLDLLLDKVTIDFDMGAELTWDITAASRLLRSAAADGFFSRLDQNRQALAELARQQAGRLVAMYLRDVGQSVSLRQLQEGLSPVVTTSDWDAFWNRARRDLAREPHVMVKSGAARMYQWVDEPVPVAGPTEVARRPRREVTQADVIGLAEQEIEPAYARLTTFTERKGFLEAVRVSRPGDWDRIFARLFNSGKDNRARQFVEHALSKERPAIWQSMLEGMLTGYRQNPEAFLWFVEQSERLGVASPKGMLARMLDLLESSADRSSWIRLRNALSADNYRLVRLAVEAMDEAEAGRLVNRLPRMRPLEGYRADEIVQIVVTRFPALDVAMADNVIYSTGHGLEKARTELRRITSEEIPRSAEEIARARAHGDLSENYEYKAAKEKQARLMQRASRLRDEVARARVISPADVDTTEVSIGCRVRLEDGDGRGHSFTLLGPWDADPEHGTISYQSPFAGVLMGKRVGDAVEVEGRHHQVAAIESAIG